MRRVGWFGTFIGALLMACYSGVAPSQMGNQQPGQTQQGLGQPSTGRPGNSTNPRSVLGDDVGVDSPMRERLQEQAARGRNIERYKRMVADTNKLLQLSTELKTEVDATTKNEMSLQVIQKAAEIEKLARDVKERMKGQ
jgi:hypothetical protein